MDAGRVAVELLAGGPGVDVDQAGFDDLETVLVEEPADLLAGPVLDRDGEPASRNASTPLVFFVYFEICGDYFAYCN